MEETIVQSLVCGSGHVAEFVHIMKDQEVESKTGSELRPNIERSAFKWSTSANCTPPLRGSTASQITPPPAKHVGKRDLWGPFHIQTIAQNVKFIRRLSPSFDASPELHNQSPGSVWLLLPRLDTWGSPKLNSFQSELISFPDPTSCPYFYHPPCSVVALLPVFQAGDLTPLLKPQFQEALHCDFQHFNVLNALFIFTSPIQV